MKINNIRLLVADFDTCFRFYSEKLGLKVTWGGTGGDYASFDIGIETSKLISLVHKTHAQNKKLILWAAPDNENTWRFLLDNGVDLINTDRITDFKKFMTIYNSSADQ
jgi:catechol 2,3-dioxygenase-like lactoylglutathione lyase family enzyme